MTQGSVASTLSTTGALPAALRFPGVTKSARPNSWATIGLSADSLPSVPPSDVSVLIIYPAQGQLIAGAAKS